MSTVADTKFVNQIVRGLVDLSDKTGEALAAGVQKINNQINSYKTANASSGSAVFSATRALQNQASRFSTFEGFRSKVETPMEAVFAVLQRLDPMDRFNALAILIKETMAADAGYNETHNVELKSLNA